MAAAANHRAALLVGALASAALVFTAFLLLERPGLGIGHFFYVPVVLAALSLGAVGGAVAGAGATALFAAAVIVNPRVPASDAFTIAMAIRAITFCGIGTVVGWYSHANRDLVDRLREQADRDFGTGLLNARAFDEALNGRCSEGRPFVLLLADMDDLKRTNDAHGHEAGNRAIGRVGATLSGCFTRDAVVARIGGDEFAVLTSTTEDEIGEIAAALSTALQRESLPTTFGWAAAPADGSVATQLFRKADDRLYAAKLLRRGPQSALRIATQEPFASSA